MVALVPIDPDTQAALDAIELQIVRLRDAIIPFDTTQVQPVDELTNSVTEGGTDGALADFTNLSTYSADAAAIRNNIYQLGRSLKQVTDALRTYGLGG